MLVSLTGSKMGGDPEDSAELGHVVTITIGWLITLVEVNLLLS